MLAKIGRGAGALLLLAALALLGPAALTAARPAAGADPPAPGDWPMYGHDPQHTNTNAAETTLSSANVNTWVQRWQQNIGSGAAPPSGAPSVAGGRVFVGSSVANGDNFFAYDAASGALAWHAPLGYISSCSNVGIGATPAISGSLVVAGGGDAAYYGLDAASGAQLWRHTMDVGASGFAWASPLLAGDRVYLGISSYCDNPSVRGEIRGIAASTGLTLTRQFFVPDTRAGAGIWNSPALSPDGNTLVVATGEDFNGFHGPYNRALISLDPITLAILQVHQEGALNQDLDYGTTPVIFHDVQGRVLVAANHKDGTF